MKHDLTARPGVHFSRSSSLRKHDLVLRSPSHFTSWTWRARCLSTVVLMAAHSTLRPRFFHVSGGFAVRFFYNLLPTYCVTDAAPSGTFMKMGVSATCATHSVGWPLALSSLPLSGMIAFKECNVNDNGSRQGSCLTSTFIAIAVAYHPPDTGQYTNTTWTKERSQAKPNDVKTPPNHVESVYEEGPSSKSQDIGERIVSARRCFVLYVARDTAFWSIPRDQVSWKRRLVTPQQRLGSRLLVSLTWLHKEWRSKPRFSLSQT